ncbi:MAG: hypothetical protein SXV54_18450 [Chloroflexota bacterium]|nr:hypothetical protein [Chloroflexota bacterium]
MSLLNSLSPSDWASLLAALFLFLGPGYGLLSFYPDRRDFDRTQAGAVSVGLAIAFWSVLLAWLHGLGIALPPTGVLVILGAGWAVGLARTRPWRTRPRTGFTRTELIERARRDASRIALWGIVILAAVARLWALRDTIAGIGIDSYHHTLIAQMIADRGILPDDYQPLAPIATFTYHFGFHSLVAAIVRLTGLKATVLVPILGQILNATAALSVAFFTQSTTHSRPAATVSAAFTGLVSVFPAFFVNWGRYPQLTGLVMLPIFLGLVWHWIESESRWPLVPFIGVLAAGVALAHYRIALMAAAAVLVLVGMDGLMRKISWATWKLITGRLTLAAAMAGALIAPWVWHVLSALQQGYPNDVGVATETFFRLERLGIGVLNYPTNSVLIGLTLAAIILGWWRRERIVISLSIWMVVMLFASTPRFAGVFLDTISVIVSLYFPASTAIGWGIVTATDWLSARWEPSRYVVWIGLAGLLVWGATNIGSIARPGLAYVRPDDLPAMEWIRENTPPSANFMVNTFHWDFLPHFVVGSDAGYWLPLLTGRRTVTAPMIYVFERSASPDLVARLTSLDQLGGHLTSPEALALLRLEGVTHVYVGQRGGPILPDELLNSPAFELEYQHGEAYVFRFK